MLLAMRAAIRLSGIAWPGRVHVLLGETHAALAVHRGEVGFARRRRRQPDVTGLADLGRHDVDVDGEQTALLDGVHDRLDHGVAVAVGRRHHGVLHHVGALLVVLLELEGVERRLVVVACPDVMHAALAFHQELVDVGGRTADMRVGRTRIAFLMSAHPDAAAARPADIAGGERDVHQRTVGAIVVVAPDEPLLVGEHRAPTRVARLRLSDPFGGLADLIDRQTRDLGCVLEAGLVGRLHLIEVRGRCVDEGLIDPTLLRDVGHPGIEQCEVSAGIDREMHHIVFAGLDFAGIDRDGAARIDDDDPRLLHRLAIRTPPSSCRPTSRAGSGPSG